MDQKLRTLGKYTLVRRLAVGGMAEIYLAEQEGPGGFKKKLVIKQILQSFAEDENFKTMFQDEARLVAQLTHPKIAQLYELGEIEDSLFIAMEFVEGVDLQEIVEWSKENNRPVPFDIAAKLMIDLMEALDYAHDFTHEGVPYNLVHRDVTPHNVMVSNDGVLKLLDFGVAKALANQSKTQAGAVKGKFAYMAPEQVQNAQLDRRVDIFAAGVVFYELLCGEKPFGDDLAAIVNVVQMPTPDPRQKRADVPAELVQVVMRATAKDPNERYADAHAMVVDLQNYLRQAGAFIGDRDIAAFVREMQGIPLTRGSGPRHTVSEAPGPLKTDSAPMSTIATPPPSVVPDYKTPSGTAGIAAPQLQSSLGEVGGPSTAELPQLGGNEGPRSNTEAISLEDSSTRKIFGVFIVLFFALVLASGALIWVFVSKKSETVEPPVAVTKTTPEVKPKTKTPEVETAFRHANGAIVSFHSTPKAKVYFEGEMVGETPFSTNLRKGSYTVTFKADKKSIEKTFEVSELINSVSVKF